MKKWMIDCIGLCSVLLLSCGNQHKATTTANNKGLKDHYQSYFNIGVAVSHRALYSWLDNFPVRNRKDYPLLFDRNL